jgi:TonB family protein
MTDASAPNSPTREPNIKGWPGLPDLMKYYPPDAERQGIEGMVDIQVTLDAQSHVTDTLIREEHPANMGFGAAASALAHIMEFDNPTGQAAQLAFKVKFALDEAAIASGVGNDEP